MTALQFARPLRSSRRLCHVSFSVLCRVRTCCAVVLAVSLGLLSACGGGGSSGPRAAERPSGFSGTIRFPGFDLGRLSEHEPNDSQFQPHTLPPCWANSSMAVGGTLGTDAAAWGTVDESDFFQFESLAAQPVRITLIYDPVDILDGSNPNDVQLTVTNLTDGTSKIALGASPLVITTRAQRGRPLSVHTKINSGNTAYQVRIDIGAGGVIGKPAPASEKEQLSEAAPDATPQSAPASDLKAAPCAASHILVQLRDGCDADAFCAAADVTRGRTLGCGGMCVHFEASATREAGEARARALAATLSAHPDVVFAEPDYIVLPLVHALDPMYPRQWNLRTVGAPGAWDITTGDENIIVGVIDTGIVDHPDLAGRIVPGYDFISDEGIAADGDGRDADPTDPGDELSPSGFSTWHGTHVAGILCANQNNGIGISGVAPNVRVMPLRAIGRTGGLVSDVADALLYAAGLLITEDGRQIAGKLPVVNLSIGLSAASSVMEDACVRASNNGVFIVGAAGNSGGIVLFPAAYPSVFAVGAVDARMLSTPYSNYGIQIELAAPGGYDLLDRWNDGWTDGIPSLIMDETVFPPVPSYGSYVGTSQAAPHVAAAAALLLSVHPTLTRQQIRQYLIGSALDIGVAGRDQGHGWGLLQVNEALNLLMLDKGEPRTDPPKILLPATSIRAPGFDVFLRVPIFNQGGGRLEMDETLLTSTFSGGQDWISATLDRAGTPGGPVSHPWIDILVLRHLLPTSPGQYVGHVRIQDTSATVIGTIEIVAHVSHLTRAGCVLRNVAIDVGSGGAPRTQLVRPEFGYRYWMRGMPPGQYRLRAGEDFNQNGLYCETGEACGYFGGATEETAVPLGYNPTEESLEGLDIRVAPPGR